MGRKILRGTQKTLADKIKRAKKVIFFLDYDGTLTPIRKKPGLAKIGKEAKSVLKKLAKLARFKVFIISGRSLKDVERIVGVEGLYYIGNHGIESAGPGLRYIHPGAAALKPFIQKFYRLLKNTLKIKGVFVENKIYTLSVHYRLASPAKVPALTKIFKSTIKDFKKNKKIKITTGKKVFEVRPKIRWDKGKSVKRVLQKEKNTRILPVCMGDDMTDEDAFRALGKKGISILVSGKPRKTHAKYRFDSPKQAVEFLKRCLDE